MIKHNRAEERVAWRIRHIIALIVILSIHKPNELRVSIAVSKIESPAFCRIITNLNLRAIAPRFTGIGRDAPGRSPLREHGKLLIAAIEIEKSQICHHTPLGTTYMRANLIVPAFFRSVTDQFINIRAIRHRWSATHIRHLGKNLRHHFLLQKLTEHLSIVATGLIPLPYTRINRGARRHRELIADSQLRNKFKKMIFQTSALIYLYIAIHERGWWDAAFHKNRKRRIA